MELDGDMLDGLDEFRDELDDDLLAIANDNLADIDICELAGVDHIDGVQSLALVVNTIGGSSVLGDLGARVPQLTSLKLSGSSISSIRDLGTCWPKLDVLWLARCGLSDLDGLHSLHMLRELYLAFNDIVDLSAFVALDLLSVLDLEANKVADLGQVEFFKQCAELADLTLQHNPVAQLPAYRPTVCLCLPQLFTLDEQLVSEADRAGISAPADGLPASVATSDDGSRARRVSSSSASSVGGSRAGKREPGEPARAESASAEEVLAQMRRELQLVMDGVKYVQVEAPGSHLGADSPGRGRSGTTGLSGTGLSSRPTTARGAHSGRPLSSGSGGTQSRPRTSSWRAAGPNALSRGSSAPIRSQPFAGDPSAASNSTPSSPMRDPGSGPSASRAVGQLSSSSEDNASALTIGTQSVFCGTGIRALRAHKLRPEEEPPDSSELPTQRSETNSASLASRGSSAEGGSRPAPAELGGKALAQAVRQQWDREYTEILLQLKAVKLEEAWEGRDSFADMEMGLEPLTDLTNDNEGADASAATSVPMPLARRPGRKAGSKTDPGEHGHAPRPGCSGLSSTATAEILTLDS